MVSSSKILTVSYGTFSCTAEGFEDPLDVVKETTHFFRGVVREDRFFGAEPPQFDPEMAAQLLQAQVNAEAQGGRLVLRGPLADPAAPAAAAVAGADVVGPHAERGMEQALTEAAERAAAEAEAEAAAAESAAIAGDTPDEVQRAPEAPRPAAGADAPVQTDLSAEAAFFAAETALAGGDSFEDEYEDEALAPAASAVSAPQASEPASTDDSVAAKLRRIRAVVSGGAAAAPALAVSDEPEGEDTVAAVSAMLGSLAAETPEPGEQPQVAAQDPEQSFEAEIDLSALHDAFQAEPEVEVEAALAPAPFALTRDFAAPEQAEPEMADTAAAEADVAIDAPAEAAAEAAADVAPAVAPEATAAEDKPAASRRVRVVKVTRASFDAAVAAGALEEEPEAADASSLSAEDERDLARELEAVKAELAAGLEDEWDEIDDLDQISASTGAAVIGTPITMTRDDEGTAEALLTELDAAETAPDFALADDLSDDDDEDAFDPETWDETAWEDEDDDALADEDEALLDDASGSEEFAAAFDDAQDTPEEDSDLDERLSQAAREDVRKAVKLSSPARVMLTETSVEDNDTSRILNETNSHLEEPEGNRRRSAIAHLRAAVAATRADRLLGRKKDAEEQAQPYREDLADVVRPRRPAATPAADAATERFGTETPLRPAPLKLVAEQRVDESAEAPQAPLRPRRVTLADIDESVPAGAQGDFAAYAESVGAHDLPELLEAAASYLSYIEGREQFSRPQLMTKVRQVEGQDDTSREDRLRSFGQLLRDGKIEKAGGGRFTVSERISFKPSARAAG